MRPHKRDYIIMNSELLKVNSPLMDDMNVRKHGESHEGEQLTRNTDFPLSVRYDPAPGGD